LVEVFKRLGGEDCIFAATRVFIKTANKSILRLCNTDYSMILTPENELVIKNNECVGFVRGYLFPYQDHFATQFYQGGDNLRGVAHQ
jgi:hypothetical protein